MSSGEGPCGLICNVLAFVVTRVAVDNATYDLYLNRASGGLTMWIGGIGVAEVVERIG